MFIIELIQLQTEYQYSSLFNILSLRANNLGFVVERVELLALPALVPDTPVVLVTLFADLGLYESAADAAVNGSQRHEFARTERTAPVVAFCDLAAAAHLVCGFVGTADFAGHAAEVVDFEVLVPLVGPFDGG